MCIALLPSDRQSFQLRALKFLRSTHYKPFHVVVLIKLLPHSITVSYPSLVTQSRRNAIVFAITRNTVSKVNLYVHFLFPPQRT